MKLRAEIRHRTVTRPVEVTEYRCVVCGDWFESRANRPALTCGGSHRVLLHRYRKRGEIPPYAKRTRGHGE